MATKIGVARLFKNSSLLFVLNLMVRLSNALPFVLLNRTQGPEAAGIFNLALSYLIIIEACALFGLDHLLVRDIAHDKAAAARIFPGYNGLRLLLSLIGLAGFGVFLAVTKSYEPSTLLVIGIIVIAVLSEGFNDLSLSLFIATDTLRMPVIVGITVSMSRIAVTSALILLGSPLPVIAAVMLGMSLGQALMNIWLLRRIGVSALPRFANAGLKQLALTALPLGIINLMWALDGQGGNVFISLRLSERDIGLYGAATTVLSGLILMPMATQQALFPALTRLYRTNEVAFRSAYDQLMTLLGAIGLGVVLGASCVAHLVLPIFGATGAQALPTLQILVWTLLFNFLNIPNSRALLLAGKIWVQVLILAISLAVNWLVLWLLLPRLGISAAAISRVVALGVFFLLNHAAVSYLLWRAPLIPTLWRPLMAGLAGLSAFYLLANQIWPMRLGGVMAVYGGVLYLLQVPQQLRRWRRALSEPALDQAAGPPKELLL